MYSVISLVKLAGYRGSSGLIAETIFPLAASITREL